MNIQQPYIHIYVGDEIRETGSLSLEQMGATQRMKFALHECRGKLIATWAELFRIIGANNVDHTKQILSKLQAKNIFQFSVLTVNADPELETLQIIYQPYVNKAELSVKRAAAGSKGGENSSKKKTKTQPKPIAKTEQNRDYDYDNDSDNSSGKVGGKGEGKWNRLPGETERSITLTKDEISNSIEFTFRTANVALPVKMIENLWSAFTIQHFNSQTEYETRQKSVSHFRNWLKFNHGNSTSSSAKSKTTASASITNLQGAKRNTEKDSGGHPDTPGAYSNEQSEEWAAAEFVDA